MRPKVLLIKLAAIGDVALAARAITDFHRKYAHQLELHWVIDRGLSDLAAALLPPDINVTFHNIDAASLFQGRAPEQALQALALLRALFTARPNNIVLLHRDKRYNALLRLAFRGSIVAVTRERKPELLAYGTAFDELALQLRITSRSLDKATSASRNQSGTVGILVAGGRNQKTDFPEKRWPHFPKLLRTIIENTQYKLMLFGSPEDQATVTAMAAGLPVERYVNLAGKLHLAEIPRALSELDAFISVDSGLAHIAAIVMTAAHQRVISLFGPTDPRIWAPSATGSAKTVLLYKAPPCSPCYANKGTFSPCRFEGAYFQHCMSDISPEEVLKSLL